MRSKERMATLTFFAVSAQKMQRAPQGTNHPRDSSGLWKTAVGETNYDCRSKRTLRIHRHQRFVVL